MVDPVAVPGLNVRQLLEDREVLAERAFEPLVDVLLGLGDPRCQNRIGQRLLIHSCMMQTVEEVVSKAEGTAAGLGILVVVGRAERREHRSQVRRSLARERHLGGAVVRVAAGSDFAIRPGLLPDPLQEVVAVATFIEVDPELAFRSTVAAGVLKHEDVTAPREELRIVRRERSRHLVVRRSVDDDRKAPRYRLALLGREVEVGRKSNSVPHRHHNVADEGIFTILCRPIVAEEPERCGGALGDGGHAADCLHHEFYHPPNRAVDLGVCRTWARQTLLAAWQTSSPTGC